LKAVVLGACLVAMPKSYPGMADIQASRSKGPLGAPLLAMAVLCSVHGLGLLRDGLVGPIVYLVVHLDLGTGDWRGAGRVLIEPAVGLQSRHAPPHHMHGLATGASPGWARQCRCAIGGSRGAQVQHLQQADGASAVGVQEAEVARAPQTLGQDVLQHQPQEVGAGQRAQGHPVGLGVSVAEGDMAVLVAQDVGLLDHPAVQVPTPYSGVITGRLRP